jgi:anti-sigma factor RsiW
MSDFGGGNQDRELWQRWRGLERSDVPAPDALTLAAYAEGRLSEEEAEPVENWLAANPAALAEVIAARTVPQSPAVASESLIADACALVAGAEGNVVPLRRSGAPWRNALAWSSVAASLVAASFIGFSMGSDAYQNLSSTQVSDNGYAETFEAVPGLDTLLSDESGI